MSESCFLKMIQILREREDLILYGNLLEVEKEEEVGFFLRDEYENEIKDFPFISPAFNTNAAIWAAKTIYISAQLILYRENKINELELLLPDYKDEIDSSAMLSADLCLRFLPSMLIQLKLIDSEDPLIEILEKKLSVWHYSALSYNLNFDEVDFKIIITDKCLEQLYLDRITKYRKLELSQNSQFKESILANFGNYAKELWEEFYFKKSE